MRKYTRPFFGLLLVVLMAVGMMPFGAFATDTGTDPAEVIEEPIEPEVPLSEEPTEHDITEPVEESDIEVSEEIQLTTRYSAGGNITVYNYFHAFFVISEMNCIDGSPFLTSKSSWPGNDPYDWGSCGGKYDLFYCIDFYAHGNANGATTKPGTRLENTPAWQAISSAGKKGIQLALIYGVPNCDSYYDNVYGYEATQIHFGAGCSQAVTAEAQNHLPAGAQFLHRRGTQIPQKQRNSRYGHRLLHRQRPAL